LQKTRAVGPYIRDGESLISSKSLLQSDVPLKAVRKLKMRRKHEHGRAGEWRWGSCLKIELRVCDRQRCIVEVFRCRKAGSSEGLQCRPISHIEESPCSGTYDQFPVWLR